MAENDKKTKIKILIGQWDENKDIKNEAEENLVGIREEILKLMDADKMDVGDYHLVKIKNYGGNTDRYKNKENGIFIYTLQIRKKEDKTGQQRDEMNHGKIYQART